MFVSCLGPRVTMYDKLGTLSADAAICLCRSHGRSVHSKGECAISLHCDNLLSKLCICHFKHRNKPLSSVLNRLIPSTFSYRYKNGTREEAITKTQKEKKHHHAYVFMIPFTLS